jgi:flagellar biosynthesis protein FlhG
METMEHMIEGKKIIAVGGGKGGVGKSVVACNLAVGFANAGTDVVLVDADLGSPNLHTLLGIERPKGSLGDLMSNRSLHLKDVLTDTKIRGLRLACGAAPILGMANPEFQKKQRLIREIAKTDAEVLVVDIGAGVSYNVIDFFNAADIRVVVVSPQITSMHNAYGFVKSSLHRLLQRAIAGKVGYNEIFQGGGWTEERMDQLLARVAAFDPRYLNVFEPLIDSFSVALVGNLLENRREANVMWAMRRMVRDFLRVDCHVVGALRRTSRVQRSVNERTPFMLDEKLGPNAQRILQTLTFLQRFDVVSCRKGKAQAVAAAKGLPKLNDQSTKILKAATSQDALDEDVFAEEILDRRRTDTRYPQNKPLLVKIGDVDHTANLVDLSRSGARVGGIPEVFPGSTIELRLNIAPTNGTGQQWSWVQAVVRYYDRENGAAGCQFVDASVARSAVDAAASESNEGVTPLPAHNHDSAAGGL